MARIVIPTGPFPSDIGSLGKAWMQDYVVAVKRNTKAWNIVFYPALCKAWEKYHAGTHELCQEKRPDGWIVQYCVPRGTVAVRSQVNKWVPVKEDFDFTELVDFETEGDAT